jgi:hypothetical protein
MRRSGARGNFERLLPDCQDIIRGEYEYAEVSIHQSNCPHSLHLTQKHLREHLDASGQALEAVRKLGLEGVVGKRLGSIYEPGERSRTKP